MTKFRVGTHPILLAVLAAWVTFFLLPNVGLADDVDEDEDEEESMSILPATPEWIDRLDLSGRGLGILGSEAKFREDHNIQSGVTIGAGLSDDLEDGQSVFFDGSLQPVERQGYGRFGYKKLGVYSLDAKAQSWREFYNTRTGLEDVTVLGTRLDETGIFPNTTNSRFLFGGGKPLVDWLTLTAGGGIDLPGPFDDAYGSILYRKVKGEMSLLKGGTIFDTDPFGLRAGPPTVAGSGPGTVFFDFPGRKDVNYETIGGAAGTRSTLGGISWRFDASAFRHEIKSNAREGNFNLTLAGSELDSFRKDTDILTARANLVGSRQLTPSLFVYAAGAFAWAQSDPNPSQTVQTGLLSAAVGQIQTRTTLSADVKTFNESVNTGLVYQPHNTLVLTADVGVRASQQDGDLTERRNESTLATGDTGTIVNSSERDHVSVVARGNVNWKAARRLSFKGHASYRYRQDKRNSRRIFGFVVAEAPEIEDYEITRETIKVGASGRYRFRGGRKLEIGYDFMYDGSDTDVDQLVNQFVVGNYTRLQHRPFVKFSGRIVGKWRGDLRFQYTFEKRDIDAPLVNAVVNPTADKGEVEFQGFTIVPTLTYQHSATLSGYASLSVGRQQWDLVNSGVAPAGFGARFASFEYDTVTENATLGVHWSPIEKLSGSASYTIYANSKSVENFGHNAQLRGAYELDENWKFTGGLRYFGYTPQNNTLDNYDVIIATVGLSSRF